jgi:hypothetical protein
MSRLSSLRPLLSLALFTLTLAASAVATAQSKAGPLVVSVSQIGKTTLEGESKFLVELRNTGVVALALPARPGWDVEGGLEMRVRPVGAAATERKVPAQPDPTRDTALAGSRRVVTLASGEALGLYRTVKTSDLFPAAGDYEVVVVYRGLGGGEVVSAPLRVRVGI